MRMVLIESPRPGVMLASTQAQVVAFALPEVTLKMAVMVVNAKLE